MNLAGRTGGQIATQYLYDGKLVDDDTSTPNYSPEEEKVDPSQS